MADFDFNALYGALGELLSSIEPHLQTVRELDAEMTDLKLSTNATTKELKDFYYSSAETAKQLGTSTQEIMSQTNEWARLGYSIKEASALAKNAVILESISPGLDMDAAAESLLAALQSFRLDSDNTLEETIALSAAASQATPDTGPIGDTLNALAENIQDKSSIISKLTETRSSPGGISPFTDADNDTLRSTYQILSDIASVWNDMDTTNREQLISSLAAGESGAVLSSIIANFETARNSMTLMAGSAGSAMQSMDSVYDSLDFKLKEFLKDYALSAHEYA
ncbi:MAG: phage tail tape measure protein [Lachnospiraceae bacterium]|nr:phage tail tape measure protein [Lachnospiraceae bacterium]